MKSEADSSHWGIYETALIPYPIPLDFTSSGNPQANREALGLEAGKPVVLTIAGNLDEDRKGGQTLHQMFRDQKFKRVQFLLAGQSQRAEDLPENVRLLGFVGDQITGLMGGYPGGTRMTMQPSQSPMSQALGMGLGAAGLYAGMKRAF